MSLEAALATASAKPAGKRPYFLTPEVERVLAITMVVAQELAVARARLDTLERLLARKGLMTRAEIEAFAPSPSEATERGLCAMVVPAQVEPSTRVASVGVSPIRRALRAVLSRVRQDGSI